jgi:uncharacterized protein YidB (DUF937 family)
MGLLEDILKTIQTTGAPSDPRAKTAPPPTPSAKPPAQAMSPLAKALLALLAIYAAKNLRRTPSTGTQQSPPAQLPSGTTPAGTTTGTAPTSTGLDDLLKGPLGDLLRGSASSKGIGGLGDLLKGPLGGLLAGVAAGTALNGGLDDLLKQLRQNGQADVVDSWVGGGENQPISHADLESVLGADTLDALADQSGLPRGQLTSGLSQELPRFVDALTPHGRLLTDEEAARAL